jgi:hypothetical protein
MWNSLANQLHAFNTLRLGGRNLELASSSTKNSLPKKINLRALIQTSWPKIGQGNKRVTTLMRRIAGEIDCMKGQRLFEASLCLSHSLYFRSTVSHACATDN